MPVCPTHSDNLKTSRRAPANCRCEAGKNPPPDPQVAPGIMNALGSKAGYRLTSEVRAIHRRNGLRWSAHFDLGRSLAVEHLLGEVRPAGR